MVGCLLLLAMMAGILLSRAGNRRAMAERFRQMLRAWLSNTERHFLSVSVFQTVRKLKPQSDNVAELFIAGPIV